MSKSEEKPHIPILFTFCLQKGCSEGTGSSCNTDVWENVGRLLRLSLNLLTYCHVKWLLGALGSRVAYWNLNFHSDFCSE